MQNSETEIHGPPGCVETLAAAVAVAEVAEHATEVDSRHEPANGSQKLIHSKLPHNEP